MHNNLNLKEGINNASEKELEKLMKIYSQNKNPDMYIFEYMKKIFRKLAFPYLRFEILISCIDKFKNNQCCSDMQKKDLRRLNQIFKILQKICLYLNIALDECTKLLSIIGK